MHDSPPAHPAPAAKDTSRSPARAVLAVSCCGRDSAPLLPSSRVASSMRKPSSQAAANVPTVATCVQNHSVRKCSLTDATAPQQHYGYPGGMDCMMGESWLKGESDDKEGSCISEAVSYKQSAEFETLQDLEDWSQSLGSLYDQLRSQEMLMRR